MRGSQRVKKSFINRKSVKSTRRSVRRPMQSRPSHPIDVGFAPHPRDEMTGRQMETGKIGSFPTSEGLLFPSMGLERSPN